MKKPIGHVLLHCLVSGLNTKPDEQWVQFVLDGPEHSEQLEWHFRHCLELKSA